MQIPHLLSFVIFLPLIGALAILFSPRDGSRAHGSIALVTTIVTFLVSLLVYVGYHPGGAEQFQFVENIDWVPAAGITYHLGVDGIGVLMVLMTTVIFPFVVGVSLPAIKDRTQMFYFLVLLMETAILGTFTTLDLILFYVFYEAMLIPLYFVIGVWGGEKRIYATMKFFLYTMVGSMLMLVSILAIYFMLPGHSFDLIVVQAQLPAYLASMGNHGFGIEMLLFLGFFAAFAVKAPIWPFHTWVPDAYAEAPTGGSIILVALKMGLYGFIRFCLPLFPHAVQQAAPVILTLGVVGVIYAALAAAVQKDLKRLIAYSSISHIGVIVLAIFSLTAAGLSGAVIQMVSHTFTTGALFIIGYFLYARRGTYEINEYGGVWRMMPWFAAAFLIVTLSAIALPGTSGFSGEFLMLLGAFQNYPWAAGIATTAAIWSAVYMLWMFQRVMHGPADKPEVLRMTDITFGEKWALAPLILLIIWQGVYPLAILKKVNQPVTTILGQVGANSTEPSPISTTNQSSSAAPESVLAHPAANRLIPGPTVSASMPARVKATS